MDNTNKNTFVFVNKICVSTCQLPYNLKGTEMKMKRQNYILRRIDMLTMQMLLFMDNGTDGICPILARI